MKRYLKRMAQHLADVGHIWKVVLLSMAGLLFSYPALAINGASAPSCATEVVSNYVPSASDVFLIGGTTACTGYDQVQVTGGVFIYNNLNVSAYNSYVPVDGQEYIIVTNDGVDTITDGGPHAGKEFTIGGKKLYLNFNGGDGNDLSLKTRQLQTITFPTVSEIPITDGTLTLSATASSGLAVTFSEASLPGICSVSGGVLTLIGKGACHVTASQSGNVTYQSAPNAYQTIQVVGAGQTLTFNTPPDKTYGDAAITLAATSSGPGTIEYSSNTVVVCTVAGDQLTLHSAGTCAVNGIAKLTATYAASPYVTRSFTVNKANQSINLPTLASFSVGANTTVTATASSGLTPLYGTTTSAVCTISTAGSVVTLKPGTCTVTASQAGNGNYNAATTVTQDVTVNKGDQTISLTGASVAKTFGDANFDLTATVASSLPVTVVSTSTGVCTISGFTVSIVSAGTCSFTASQAGDANYNAATDVSQSFAVNKAAQNITFGALSAKVFGDASFSLSATASSSLIVGFASTTTSICTVSGNVVTVIAAGNCSISASQAGDTDYNAAIDAVQAFIVGKANQSITFAPLVSKVFGDANFNLSATASSSLAASYASTTSAVCTVSGNAVTIVGGGSCSITASQIGDADYNGATDVVQTFTVDKAAQTITFAALSAKTFGDANFNLTSTASSSLAPTFASTTTPVCTVSGNAVTIVSAGNCSITASQVGDSNYNAATDVVQVFAVGKSAQTITFAALSAKTFGDASFNLSATASSSLASTFASTTSAVCTVSGNAVTVVATGSCSITASQSGDTDYNAATDAVQAFTVNKAAQTITFGALSAKAFGDANFNLAATASSSLTPTYASTTTAVCTVSGSAVTIVTTGSCSITASQTGDTNYDAATDVVQAFNIGKSAQTISFAALSSKTFGDANFNLSATASSSLAPTFASTTASVCTVSGNAVTIVSVGSCSITASQAGDTNYNAATDVVQSFAVGKASQTISFGVLSAKTFGQPNFNLTATASSSLTPTFASTTAAVCTVSGNAVTIVTPGSCSITASQAGDADYDAATDVVQAFTVSKAAQTITFGALSAKNFGDATFNLTSTASSSLAPTFASTTTPVCTVSGNAVTLIGAGNCSITASQVGDSNYNAATDVVQSFAVGKSAQSISFGVLSAKTFGDTSFNLAATASSSLTPTFASTTSAVCTVSGNAVTVVATGSCSITASQAGDTNYNAATDAVQAFTVNKAAQTITFGALSAKAFGDANFNLAATASSSLTPTYASTTTAVCTVSGSAVTIVTTGSCSITASQTGGTNYDAATDVVQAFNIGKSAQTISFAALSSKTFGDANFNLSATASSSLAPTFASTTASVCTVSGNAVTIVSVGSCSITASQAGDTNYNAATDVVQGFAVGKAAQTITFGALSAKTFGDASFNLTATASSSLAPTFASTTAAVCTVSGNAVTIVTPGSCSITASQIGDADYNAATDVVQAFSVGKASQTITFGALSAKNFGDAAFNLTSTASSSLTPTYASTTMPVCTVSGNAVTLIGAGNCSITASQTGDSNYNAATDVVQAFTVGKSAQTITFGALSAKTFGDTSFNLAATASSSLTATYASTTSAVCTVSGNAVTIVATGSCSITASQAGDINYNAATDTVQEFTVNKAAQTINFGALSAKAFGDANFNLAATASSSLTPTYASTTAAVCTVSGSAVTIVTTGSCSITASQTGDTNYDAATDVVQAFNIGKSAQTISFAALSSKTFGDANFNLSATASSSLAPTFASTTASICTVSGNAVTIVSVGSCSITASQTGDTNYNAATDVVQSFAVGKAAQTISFGVLSAKTFGQPNFNLTATASSSLTPTFASTTTAVCTVSGNAVTIVTPGSCSITASQAGDADYNVATDVVQTFTVSKAAQTITFGALSAKNFGDAAFNLTSTASSSLAPTFASTTTPVCTVSGNAVTLIGAGNCSITASQVGDSNYNAATDVVQVFAVGKSAQTITFGALSAKTFGDTSFNLAATASSSLTPTYASTTSAVCTVSGNAVTVVATGSCSITASQAGDTNYNAATDAVQAFTVNKAAQTITFGALSAKAFGDANFNLVATASSSLTPTYASTTAAVCTVSGSAVTIVTTGSCSITASQAGDTNYNAATDAVQAFNIGKSAQTIAFAALSAKTFGDASFNLSATASSSLAATFASTTASICTVSGSAVTIVSVGNCSITASQAGDTNYNAATDVVQGFTVGKAVQTITFGALSAKTFGDASFNLTATASSSLAPTFASTTTGVCTVSGSAVTIVAAGSCSITAAQAGDASYNAATDVAQAFTVNKGVQTITFAALTDKTYSDANVALTASASSSLSVSYLSTTTGSCLVLGANIIIGTPGTCSITASQAGDSNYLAATDVVQSFTINKGNQTISFASLTAKTFGDASFALSATASSSLAPVFASTTAAVCTVSGTNVTIVSAGNCSITASQAGDTNYNAATDVVQAFVVSKSAQTITFAALAAKVFGDSNFDLAATASSSLAPSYVSTTTSVCTVSGNTVAIVAVGNCSITAAQAGDNNYDAATDQVQAFIVSKAPQTITFAALPSKALGDANFALTATASSALALSYATTTTSVCTVSGATVSIVAIGSCILTASQAGDSNYTAAIDVTQRFTVVLNDTVAPAIIVPSNITVAAVDANGAVNTDIAISAFLAAANATDAVDGTVAVTNDAPTTFPLGVNTVTFSATDSAGNIGTAQATVTVADQAIPVITLTGNTAITLNQNATYTEPGFSATDNVDGDITANVTVTGTVTTATVGVYTLTYNVSDAATNAAATVSRQVTVQDASAPVVIAPNNITVAAVDASGTPNSNATIASFLTSANASDAVDGTIAVTNNAPTAFPLGATIVTFSATDSAGNVGSTQATVTIADQSIPVITLTGNTAITLNQNAIFSEPGFGATDNVDGTITANVVIAGAVNTATVGVYTLTYNVSDAAGNAAATLSRQVTVQDASAPVVIAPNNITVAAVDASGTPNNNAAISSFLSSANASDAVDGTVAVTNNAPTTFPLGTTTVTFSATDSAGNAGTAQATVTVADQSIPVITLIGNTAITLNQNATYSEPGYSATDNVDGTLTGNVTVGGAVNTATVGVYTLTYNVSDAAGNAAATLSRQVTVQDASAPVVVAPNNITVAAVDASGTPNSNAAITSFLASASASDAVDGTIAVTNNAPTTFSLGATSVTFSATDSAGNTGTAQATVTVTDQSIPVITLTGNTAITLNQNATYSEPGFVATDNVDGTITANVVIAGAVNTATVGVYTLTYNLSDAAGNAAATVSRQITVQDASAPVVVAPNNITVAAVDASGASSSNAAINSFLSSASASDIVDGVIAVTNNAPTAFPLGTTTVTFSATDSAGNTGSAQATVTVADQSIPVITLTGNTAITLNQNATYSEPGYSATDNVDGAITASVTVSGTVNTSTVGVYTLTYNVSDAAGNAAATLSRQVTVLDASAPVVVAPSNITVAAVDGSGTPNSNAAIASFLASASASDAVDGSVAVTNNAPTTFSLGATVVTFSATDSAGNTGSAQATVTVTDQSIPVITLTGSTAIALNQNATYSEPGYSATDNVDGDITTSVVVSGAVNTATVGVYTLTYNVSDAAGNAAAEVSRQITVLDALAPVVVAPSNITVAAIDASGTPNSDAAIASFLSFANASDAVDGVIAVTNNAPTTFSLGATIVTFLATDSAGNTGTAQATVTVADQSIPVITLAGFTSITLNHNGTFVEPGFNATDNVDGDITANVAVAGVVNTAVIGVYTLSYSVSDAAGNAAANVSRRVTVQDATAPSVIAPNNITVAAVDANGTPNSNVTITSFLSSANASDVVDGAVSVSHNAPTTFALGATVVTFSATDNAGNTGSAQASVTVTDLSSPVITLAGNTAITLNHNDTYNEAGFTATDNVDGDITASVSVAGTVNTGLVGVYTLTYSVSDNTGNAAAAVSRQVTVQDAAAPVVIAPNNITVAAVDATGTPNSDAAIVSFLSSANASDLVDGSLLVTHNAPATFPLGATTVTFSATDSAGNIGSSQATVTITDQDIPVITLVGNTAMTLNHNATYLEPGFSALDNVDGDITANVVVAGAVNTATVGVYTLTYTVSDAAGNAAAALSRQVTVQDAAAPTVIAPNNITVAAVDANGTPDSDAAIASFLTSANANDVVDGSINVTHNAPFTFPLGITTVIFSATDSTGNTGTAQATVTVVDQAIPVITLTGNTAMTLTHNATYVEPGFSATDNVDGDITANVVVAGAVNTATVGVYTLTYTVSDAAGNSAAVSRQVTVQDAAAPIVIAPNDITVAAVDANGTPSSDATIANFLNSATASDLVDGSIIVTHNAPSLFPLGSTAVTFSATDSVGNTGIAQATVTVQDVAIPAIVVPTGITVAAIDANGTPRSDASIVGFLSAAIASDAVDGVIAVTNNAPATFPLGATVVTFLATDSAGNSSTDQSTVNVTDQSNPVISLTGSIAMTLNLNDNFVEPGFIAIDNVDGDITANVVVTNDVNTTALGVYAVTYNVSDSALNAATSLTRQITVQDGTVTDTDGDGVVDTDDAFPNDSTESVDTDLDGIGNNADTDDDNDGILDVDDSAPLDPTVGDNQPPVFGTLVAMTFEATGVTTSITLVTPVVTDNNLNAPTVVSDLAGPLALGNHSITWTATDFAGNQSTAQQAITISDTIAPVLNAVAPVALNAQGRLTDLSTAFTAVGSDIVDGEIAAVIVGVSQFTSGQHSVELSATDASGNVATTTTQASISPALSVAPVIVVEAGGQYPVAAYLSGAAPTYPADFTYQLNLNGVSLGDFTGSIAADTEGQLLVTVPENVVSTDTLSLTLSSATNAFVGNESSTELRIIVTNVAPLLELAITQNGSPVSVIDATNGAVVVSASIKDGNLSDTHNITWAAVNNAFVDAAIDNNVLTFELDPSNLTAGTYSLNATVTESNTAEALSVNRAIQFVVETLPTLSATADTDGDGIPDAEEGYSDSDGDGIADYLDNDSNTTRLPSSENTEPMQVEPGLTMSVGSTVQSAQGAGSQNASIAVADLANAVDGNAADPTDNGFVPTTPLYNFAINGLVTQGDSVAVIIPLSSGTVLPQGAVYRKYNTVQGWFSFVEDNKNTLSSAQADASGNCPPANAPAYTPSLTEGDNCMQLLIEDGGPNDTDFTVNGSIEDPGAIVVENLPPVVVTDLSVTVNEETAVTLDASGSNDVEGAVLSFVWMQTQGTAVTLTDTTAATLQFTSPAVATDETLTFELTVSDGVHNSVASIAVLVKQVNQAPMVAIDTHAASAVEGTTVTLTTQSSDPDGDVLSIKWVQISGPAITFDDSTAAQVNITMPQVSADAVIELSVTVSDSMLSATSTTTLTVTNKVEPEPKPPVKTSGGGSIVYLLLLMLALVMVRRERLHS